MRNRYSKYGAVKTKGLFKGEMMTFDSKKEYARAKELELLERAGVIKDLQVQVPFIIIPKSKYGPDRKYIADFTYYENGEWIVEDCKGFKTEEYKLKKRLMAERKGIIIRET